MKNLRKISLFALLLAFTVPALTQVAPSATGGGNSIDAFATGSFIESGYHGAKLGGYAFGADYMVRPWIGLDATLQLSIPRNFGALPHKLSERELLFGPVIRHRIGRFTVYGDGLAGLTAVTYPSTNFQDTEVGFAVGGGADYRLTRHFSVRLIDFKWIDRAPGLGPPTPFDYNSGIVYHF